MLRRANEILNAGFGFLRGGARPPTQQPTQQLTQQIVEFVGCNRDEFGVEPICDTLQVAPSTYYAVKKGGLSVRELAVQGLMPLLLGLCVTNRELCGVHELWKAAQGNGHGIGRGQVARLMKRLSFSGVTRGWCVVTTRGGCKGCTATGSC